MSLLQSYHIFDILPAHVAVVNHNQRVAYANSSWRRHFDGYMNGGSPMFMDVLKALDFLGDHFLDKIRAAIEAILEGDRAAFEHVYLSENGDIGCWYKFTVSPFEDGLVVMHDTVSKSVVLNHALGEESLLRSLLHDIKSPLSLMTSLSYLIETADGQKLSEKSKYYLRSVDETADELLYKLALISQHLQRNEVHTKSRH